MKAVKPIIPGITSQTNDEVKMDFMIVNMTWKKAINPLKKLGKKENKFCIMEFLLFVSKF